MDAYAANESVVEIEAREQRAPVWAAVAPLVYLAVCALAARAAFAEHAPDVLAGVLVAVGLAPAFAVPFVFSTRRATLTLADGDLFVDARFVKLDCARLTRADRGGGRLVLETRSGERRIFLVPSYGVAQQLVARLPPISIPAGALAA